MPKEVILNGIINAYREIIKERYQYDSLKEKFELPISINENQINEIRNYFLTYLYPESTKRKELNEAFENLDNYIKNPSKLLQILVDSASLIFKHGRHLPKILNSGIKALRSFRDANNFEKRIVEQAIRSKQQPPFNTKTIYSFIKKIPRKDIEQFIESTKSLFNILHDKTQVKKIIEIVAFLISKMKKNHKIYTTKEIKGLELGYELINKGNELFEKLGTENQQLLIDFIVKIETYNLDEVYGKK